MQRATECTEPKRAVNHTECKLPLAIYGFPVTVCKTLKIADVLIIVQDVTRLRISSTMAKTKSARRLYMVINLQKHSDACVSPAFERVDVFIFDDGY